VQIKIIKFLSGIVGVYFLAWAMKLSYGDVLFWGIFGGGVYFIIYCIKSLVYKIKGKK
jgi:hypothetical protein